MTLAIDGGPAHRRLPWDPPRHNSFGLPVYPALIELPLLVSRMEMMSILLSTWQRVYVYPGNMETLDHNPRPHGGSELVEQPHQVLGVLPLLLNTNGDFAESLQPSQIPRRPERLILDKQPETLSSVQDVVWHGLQEAKPQLHLSQVEAPLLDGVAHADEFRDPGRHIVVGEILAALEPQASNEEGALPTDPVQPGPVVIEVQPEGVGGPEDHGSLLRELLGYAQHGW